MDVVGLGASFFWDGLIFWFIGTILGAGLGASSLGAGSSFGLWVCLNCGKEDAKAHEQKILVIFCFLNQLLQTKVVEKFFNLSPLKQQDVSSIQ
ncbi:hypothetical protein KGF86_03495 [Ornithinibacillus massiliensis]|uniref:Uncharacterized protein n=1 Tax=Ornithinibacillus massiliensis TaxID=1944633 RepID=A0ABS5MB19_9BACI|nr:hypothetical protein [Ornithinibacillus massiliensis]MBS3679273.1 hypothetical protein [Ornithinibacillus massiliensis]